MSLEIAWKQNILVTDFHLLKLLLVVLGFGSQTNVCGFSRQNICSVFGLVPIWVSNKTPEMHCDNKVHPHALKSQELKTIPRWTVNQNKNLDSRVYRTLMNCNKEVRSLNHFHSK